MGRVFGHKFQPRYDEKITGAASAAPQLERVWSKAIETRLAVRTDVTLDLRKSFEALANHEKLHTHDVCARCGQVVFAPRCRHATAPLRTNAAVAGE